MPLSQAQLHALETLVVHPFTCLSTRDRSARACGLHGFTDVGRLSPIVQPTTVRSLLGHRYVVRLGERSMATLTAEGLQAWATDRLRRGIPTFGIQPDRRAAMRVAGTLRHPRGTELTLYQLLQPLTCALCGAVQALASPVVRVPALPPVAGLPGAGPRVVSCLPCEGARLADALLRPFALGPGRGCGCGCRTYTLRHGINGDYEGRHQVAIDAQRVNGARVA